MSAFFTSDMLGKIPVGNGINPYILQNFLNLVDNPLPNITGTDARGEVFDPVQFQQQFEQKLNDGTLPVLNNGDVSPEATVANNTYNDIYDILSQGGVPSATGLMDGINFKGVFGDEFGDVIGNAFSALAGISDYNTALNLKSASTAYERQNQLLDKTMDYNAAEALASRDWQKAMVESQNLFTHDENEALRNWQRDMRDTSVSSYYNQLKELGVNPILAFNSAAPSVPNSAGASGQSFSGSSASVSSPSLSGQNAINNSALMDVVLFGLNSAVSVSKDVIGGLSSIVQDALSLFAISKGGNNNIFSKNFKL